MSWVLKPRVPTYLGGLGYRLGEQRAITELPSLSPAQLSFLRDNGLVHYRCADAAPWQLAVDSVRGSLASAGRPASAINGVFFCSNSFAQPDWVDFAPSRFLSAAELGQAVLFGVSLAGCAGPLWGLASAVSAVQDGQDVLLVSADSAQGMDRSMSSGAGVFSDGAASCLVGTTRPARGFEVEAVVLHGDARMHVLDPATDALALLAGTAAGVKAAVRTLYDALDVQPSAFHAMVCNNYNRSVLRTFAAVSGVPYERLYNRNIGLNAHVFGADTLINLADLNALESLEDGQRILLFGSGHNFWGAASLVFRGTANPAIRSES